MAIGETALLGGLGMLSGGLQGLFSWMGGDKAIEGNTEAARIQAEANDKAMKFYADQLRLAREDQEPFRQGGLYALERLMGTAGMRHSQSLPVAPSTSDPRVSGPLAAYEGFREAIASGTLEQPPAQFNSLEEAAITYELGREYYDRMLPQGMTLDKLPDPGKWLSDPHPVDAQGNPLDERLWRYPDERADPAVREQQSLTAQQQAMEELKADIASGKMPAPPDKWSSLDEVGEYYKRGKTYFDRIMGDYPGMNLERIENPGEWLKNPYPVDTWGRAINPQGERLGPTDQINAFNEYQEAVKSGKAMALPKSFDILKRDEVTRTGGGKPSQVAAAQLKMMLERNKGYYDRMLPEGMDVTDLPNVQGWLKNPYPVDQYGNRIDTGGGNAFAAPPPQQPPVQLQPTVQTPASVQPQQGPALSPQALLRAKAQRLLEGRQYGGSVRSNQPYVVGEAGPELMVPEQSGTVVPNLTGNMFSANAPGPGGRPMRIAEAISAAGGGGRPGKVADFMLKWRDAGGQPPVTYTGQPVPTTAPGGPPTTIGGNTAAPPPAGGIDWSSLGNTGGGTTPIGYESLPGDVPGLLDNVPQFDKFSFDKYLESPWYTLPLQEGQQALERSAIGRGDLYSGGFAKDLTKYGQDYGFSRYMTARGQEEAENMNAFNRWVTGNLNPMQSLLGVGQTATTNMANTGMQGAGDMANLYNYGGQASASAPLGNAAAYQNMYAGYGNAVSNLTNPMSYMAGNYANQDEPSAPTPWWS